MHWLPTCWCAEHLTTSNGFFWGHAPSITASYTCGHKQWQPLRIAPTTNPSPASNTSVPNVQLPICQPVHDLSMYHIRMASAIQGKCYTCERSALQPKEEERVLGVAYPTQSGVGPLGGGDVILHAAAHNVKSNEVNLLHSSIILLDRSVTHTQDFTSSRHQSKIRQ